LKFSWSAIALILIALVFSARPLAEGVGPGDAVVQEAFVLKRRAVECEVAGDIKGGLRLRQMALRILADQLGHDDARVDGTRVEIATALMSLGQYAASRSNLLQSLEWRRTRLPTDIVRVAELLNLIGETHRRAGNSLEAVECYRRVISDLANNPEGALVRATSFANLGSIQHLAGDHREAAASLTQARELQGTNASPLSRAMVLVNLAGVQRSLGEFRDATRLAELAFNLTSNLPPPVRIQAGIEAEWAKSLESDRRIPEALTVRSNILFWYRLRLGPTNLQSLAAQRALAQSFLLAARPSAALPLLTNGLELARAYPGHPLRMALALDLGDCRQDLCEFDEAARAYAEVLRAVGAASGSLHPQAVGAKLRLAQLARLRGDYSTAAELYAQLIAGLKALAPASARPSELAEVLVAQGTLSRILGRPDKANAALEEALTILPDEPQSYRLRADALMQQALLARGLNDRQRARELRELARTLRMRTFGRVSLAVAETYIADAEQCVDEGHATAALDAIQGALAITTQLDADNLHAAAMIQFLEGRALSALGESTKAEGRLQAAFDTFVGLRSRQALESGQELGFMLLRLGRTAEAAALDRRTTALASTLWSEVAGFGSEADQLAWRDHVDLFSLPAALAPFDPAPLAEAVLKFKGAVLDSLAAQQQLRARNADPDVFRWSQARERRRNLEQRAVIAPDSLSEELVKARREMEEAESVLTLKAGQTQGTYSGVRWETVRDLVPDDTVLADFVRFRSPDSSGRLVPKFGAVLLKRGDPPRWVDLGPAEPIRTNVLALAQLMAQPVTPGSAETVQLLGELHRLVWIPVRAALGPTLPKQLLVAPDAELHFLPWSLLWEDGRFLGEKVSIQQVSSGRDLLREPIPEDRTGSVVVVSVSRFTRPGWQRTLTTLVADAVQAAREVVARRGISNDELPTHFPPLEETSAEGEKVAALARAGGYSKTVSMEDGDATEGDIRRIASPHILHLATHAKFLKEPALANPMNRAWIALWRAGETLADWRVGRFADLADDGILTAEELSELNLRKTWLVTISACDTGLGDQRNGEGVFGMKRALAMAGAGQVLLTLWPVHDRDTRQLMEDFYQRALRSHDARTALFEAQSGALQRLRTKDGPGAAAQRAGPFVLTGFTR
jgi:CHAT domain-containing protein/tetratricopeptide (TPR) repeat protein